MSIERFARKGTNMITCTHSAGISHDAATDCAAAGATFEGTPLDVVADGTAS
jgi:hypothetical protein